MGIKGGWEDAGVREEVHLKIPGLYIKSQTGVMKKKTKNVTDEWTQRWNFL